MTSTIVKGHQYESIESQNSYIKKSPQLRLTVDEVLQRRPFMRCDQYLADILAAMKKIGFTFRIHNILEFCDKIGLNIRTFQRARRLLIDAGKLVENRLNRDSIELFLVPIDDRTIAQDDKPIAQDDTSIAQDDKPIAVTPLEPIQALDSRDSSTLRSTTYTDSLSVPPTTQKREREIKKSETEEIEPEYWDWLHAQALKMPRAIGNIPVWIRSVSKRSEWRETFVEWLNQSREGQRSAAPSPSTHYSISVHRSPQELAEMKIAIEKARKSMRVAV